MIGTGTSKDAGIQAKAVHIDHPPHRHLRHPFHAAPRFQIALLQGGLPGQDYRLAAGGAEDGLCGQLYPGCLHT